VATPTGLEDVAASAAAPAARPSLRARAASARATETAAAAGLAAAGMAANGIAVVITVVFTRLLGTGGYGALAALINLGVVLYVPGSALQAAAARAGARGRLGRGGELAATARRWTRRITLALLAVAAVAVLARDLLAGLLDVRQHWAAAAVPITGGLWLLLSLQRGLLQAQRAYRPVGVSIVLEAAGRLLVGLGLVLAGAGVTGAYLGTVASLAATAFVLHRVLRRRLGGPGPPGTAHRLWTLTRGAGAPIAALTLVAVLQNADVIVARHTLPDDAAGVYAATTVAAKALVWMAVGLGLWVLPEAAHRVAAGRDPRGVLARAAGVVGVVAVPALTIYALAPAWLLGTAFGAQYAAGADVLALLGVAYALLALTLLAVQYQLGLHRRAFLAPLLVAAAAEPALLAATGSLHELAVVVLAVQAAAAAAVMALAVRRR
jgi:O-antigen/teichoic acid export membrane protein